MRIFLGNRIKDGILMGGLTVALALGAAYASIKYRPEIPVLNQIEESVHSTYKVPKMDMGLDIVIGDYHSNGWVSDAGKIFDIDDYLRTIPAFDTMVYGKHAFDGETRISKGIFSAKIGGIEQEQDDVVYLEMPGEIPSYLEAELERHKNFRLTDREQTMVDNFDTLIDYFAKNDYAKGFDRIDPDFMKSIIAVESRGNPNAVSSRDARGLVQFMIPTAKEYGKRVIASGADLDGIAKGVKSLGFDVSYINKDSIRRMGPDCLHDPALNLLLAGYAMKEIIEKYGNNHAIVASIWNAGETQVRKFNSNRKIFEIESWIPPNYRETRNYVAKTYSLRQNWQEIPKVNIVNYHY